MNERYEDPVFFRGLLKGEVLISLSSVIGQGTDQYLAWVEEAIAIVGAGAEVLMDLQSKVCSTNADENGRLAYGCTNNH